MREALEKGAHTNTGIGYLIFDEPSIAKGFDIFAKHEFRRLVKQKISVADREYL
jgi:hypothetical protein